MRLKNSEGGFLTYKFKEEMTLEEYDKIETEKFQQILQDLFFSLPLE